MLAVALDLVTPTLRDVAGWLNVSYATIRSYKADARNPSPATVRRFAKALRRHASHLERMADRLERRATP